MDATQNGETFVHYLREIPHYHLYSYCLRTQSLDGSRRQCLEHAKELDGNERRVQSMMTLPAGALLGWDLYFYFVPWLPLHPVGRRCGCGCGFRGKASSPCKSNLCRLFEKSFVSIK